ncbi:EcsC family protein [Bacillus sp. OV322]|uniref:EcsC family protein n=1 Tax=Bacillus sp. OV322 TaxID=1882764 RepID=UPI000B86872E|nr:EcsC family protein [Bacillus sp. OV322]
MDEVIRESTEQLNEELRIIKKWEKAQKGLWFWEKIGRIPFKLLDKFTPAFIQKKLGVLLDELGSFVQTGGQYLTKEKHVLHKMQIQMPDAVFTSISDIQNVPLSVMKSVSDDLNDSSKQLAAIQGASTGIGGVFTLAVDIPILLGLSLKTIQDTAIAYGYNPKVKKERIFIVKCMQFATADTVGKEAILNELSSYSDARESQAMMSQLQGWREVIYTYRDQYGWKKLLQMVPVAGMIFGAFTNRSMIADIGETAGMLYRKRRIMERLAEKQSHITDAAGE